MPLNGPSGAFACTDSESESSKIKNSKDRGIRTDMTEMTERKIYDNESMHAADSYWYRICS